jgi:hypothetical protein
MGRSGKYQELKWLKSEGAQNPGGNTGLAAKGDFDFFRCFEKGNAYGV